MASFYTIVRYVPDPIADERTNIGVIVFGEGQVRSRFITNWQRAQSLGGEDLSFLKSFGRLVQQAASAQKPLLPDIPSWSEEVVKRIAGRWHNSIQISEPRGSLKSPDALLKEVTDLYLRLNTRPRKTGSYQTKRTAVTRGRRSIAAAVERRFGPGAAEGLLQGNKSVPGKFDQHAFDIVLKNGTYLLAAQGLSFQLPDPSSIDTEIEVTAWAIDDVHKQYPTLPLAVLAVPPLSHSSKFDRAEKIFRGLGAELITVWGDDALTDWAAARVDALDIKAVH